MIYCITYELKNPTKDYSLFFQTLKSFGDFNQFIANGWFVIAESGKKESFFNQLKEQLDKSDLLLVAETSLPKLSGWLPASSVDWLVKQPQ